MAIQGSHMPLPCLQLISIQLTHLSKMKEVRDITHIQAIINDRSNQYSQLITNHPLILMISSGIIPLIDQTIQFLPHHQQTILVLPNMKSVKIVKMVDTTHMEKNNSMIAIQILVEIMLLIKEIQINIAKTD
jgi:hypothetical protein